MAAAIYLLFLYPYKSFFLRLEIKKENIRGRNLVFSKKKQEEKRTPMDKKISKQSVKAQSLAQRSYAETTR